MGGKTVSMGRLGTPDVHPCMYQAQWQNAQHVKVQPSLWGTDGCFQVVQQALAFIHAADRVEARRSNAVGLRRDEVRDDDTGFVACLIEGAKLTKVALAFVHILLCAGFPKVLLRFF